MPRCFIFKPDGIGDFFLASGVIRLLAQEFGEENLIIAVLPPLKAVVKGQFPRASVIGLPIRKQRILLNVFVANLLRCFPAWMTLLGTRVDISISLRHMRDYLQNFLFCSVPADRRMAASNLLLGNGRPVRRWTEHLLTTLFSMEVVKYPSGSPGIPSELEANRLLVAKALKRKVEIHEIWPELKAIAPSSILGPYFVCAPFSTDIYKNFPENRWVELFTDLHSAGRLPHLVLTGSPDQKPRLEAFLNMLANTLPESTSQHSIVIPDNLQGFIDLLAGADCVFTVDTAAAHAATALNCRTMVLFSGLHQGMFAPWKRSDRQQWISPQIGVGIDSWHEAHSTASLRDAYDEISAVP